MTRRPPSERSIWFAIDDIPTFDRLLHEGGPVIGDGHLYFKMVTAKRGKERKLVDSLHFDGLPICLQVYEEHLFSTWPRDLTFFVGTVLEQFPVHPEYDDRPDEALARTLRPFGCKRIPRRPRMVPSQTYSRVDLCEAWTETKSIFLTDSPQRFMHRRLPRRPEDWPHTK